jgi:hypothetical protein
MNGPIVRVYNALTGRVFSAYMTGPYLREGDFVIAGNDGRLLKATENTRRFAIGTVFAIEYPEGCLNVWDEKAAT